MNKYVILHGHFYQPPREDPWSGIINYQESARPFSDWNKRITAECYAACTSSRVLDGAGKILSIVNNYEKLSWNFGPTLLTWLEKEAPNVYERILAADRESLQRLGHGNAVAQGYNHTIMPLDRPRDIRTQVLWGLEDFRHRFEREADGLWLPECAASYDVIDILIEQKLSYVILSPWQAKAIRDETGDWFNLDGQPGPTDRPFLIQRPGGNIAAFFYDPELASGISFGHLLQSREGFEAALRNGFERIGGNLISIATDGEIYGHHEPFGDMCLAALTDNLGDDSDLIFTNYASYLAENPPIEEVSLQHGDDGLGSSWSCSHGVGRWMRDCGCSTGGDESWTQQWRGALRDAFNLLRDSAEPVWESTTEGITGKPAKEVLNSYASVLSGSEKPEDFILRNLGTGYKDKTGIRLLEALEGAKYLQFMYTSCGWFFSELSGLEPVQNIRYAYRAAELLDTDGSIGLLKILRDSLKKAQSNIPEKGSGADLLVNEVSPVIPPDAEAAAALFWSNLYNIHSGIRDHKGDLHGRISDQRTVGTAEGKLHLEGSVEFVRVSTLRKVTVPFKAEVDGRLFCPEISVSIEEGKWLSVPISAMNRNLRYTIRDALLKRSEKKLRRFIGNQALIRLQDMKMVRELALSPEDAQKQSVELSLHYGPILALKRLAKLRMSAWPEALVVLNEILGFREEYGMDSENSDIESRAGDLISDIAEKLQQGCNRMSLDQLVNFLSIIHAHGLRPLKPYAQNSVYALLKKHFSGNSESESAGIDRESLLLLAEMMNINPERFTD